MRYQNGERPDVPGLPLACSDTSDMEHWVSRSPSERLRTPMSVIVGAATSRGAAIAGDSSYFRLHGGVPTLVRGPARVFRAGPHAADVAGVADYEGTSFLEVLDSSLEAARALEELPDRPARVATGQVG